MGVKVTTREGWVKLECDSSRVVKAQQVFQQLEQARQQGVDIQKHEFNNTLKAVTEERDETLSDIVSTKIVTSSRKPPVLARSANQRAYVEAIHFFKTRKEETMQILRKYSRVEDRGVLEHTQSWFSENMPDYPYPPVDGYQVVAQEMASTQAKAGTLNVKELVDARFVKELEDTGFVAGLSKK